MENPERRNTGNCVCTNIAWMSFEHVCGGHAHAYVRVRVRVNER